MWMLLLGAAWANPAHFKAGDVTSESALRSEGFSCVTSGPDARICVAEVSFADMREVAPGRHSLQVTGADPERWYVERALMVASVGSAAGTLANFSEYAAFELAWVLTVIYEQEGWALADKAPHALTFVRRDEAVRVDLLWDAQHATARSQRLPGGFVYRDPWEGLPIGTGSVVHRNTLEMTVVYDQPSYAAQVPAWTGALEAQGWSRTFQSEEDGVYTVFYDRAGTQISFAGMEAMQKTTISVIRL